MFKMIRQLFYVLVFLCGLASAQETSVPTASKITRKDLLTATIASEKAVSKVEIKEITLGPKQSAPLHLHPCPVVGVVTEGTISFQIEGEAIQHLKAGDAFYEPADTRIAHFDNDGETPVRFTAFYLLGKDEHELIRVLPK